MNLFPDRNQVARGVRTFGRFHEFTACFLFKVLITECNLSYLESDLLQHPLHQHYNHNYHYWQLDLHQLHYWLQVCISWKTDGFEL